MPDWPASITSRIAPETHFGRANLKCFTDRPAHLPAMLAQAVARNPAGDALVCDDIRLSYVQLDQQIAGYAAGLAAQGIGPGDRVALVLANGPAFLPLLMGVIALGAIAVPVNVREGTPELAHILNDCGARILIHDGDIAAAMPAAPDTPTIERRFAVGATAPGSDHIDDLLHDPRPGHAPAALAEEDTAVILYTSGTTGKPKGAMLTHFNIIHSAMHFEACMELGSGERSLLAVPASHVTGLVATLFTMLRTAGCSVIMRSFTAEGFAQTMAAERVTQTLMVPAMYNLFLLRCTVADHDLSHWRIGGYGGAPMAQSTVDAMAKALPDLKLMNAYGATEVTSPATILPMGFGVTRSDSVGICVPCGDIRICDSDGQDVPDGTPGELWIKGPMVVPGYWNNPEKTAAEFRGGYWTSGDVGSRDAEGFIRLHDRRKDMIIRGGYNIYSAEVENTLTAHEDVIECAAIGQPDPVLGEKLHVFIYTEAKDLTLENLRAFCAAHLADYKRPDFATFQQTPLPRNANGKILKNALRAGLSANSP